jgi:GntR family transcriptional regulator
MEERVPKYYQLKKALIKKIEMEEFKPDEPIPSERELIEIFQMSRITVRKAIDELVNEGYLYKVHGKGTYVKNDMYSQDLFSITSCTDDVLKFGMTASKKLVSAAMMKANTKRSKALNITVDDNVFCLERIQYANDEPLNFTIAYLPEKLFPGIEKHDFSSKSLYHTIEQDYGVKITKATRTIEAVLAEEDIAEYLDIEEKMPIILFGCVTYGIVNGKEVPIETFKCYYRTDKFKFYINQVR